MTITKALKTGKLCKEKGRITSYIKYENGKLYSYPVYGDGTLCGERKLFSASHCFSLIEVLSDWEIKE
jgi:hypothetical protein